MPSVRVRVAVAALGAFVVAAAPAASGGDSTRAHLTFVRNGSIFVVAADGRGAKVYLRAKSEKGGRTTMLPACLVA